MNYKEKLKDERWIRRKREILIRDKYSCRLCGHNGIDDHELHVHHISYEKGHEPWDYDNFHLVTLCSDCHEWVHKTNMNLRMRMSRISGGWICEEQHDWNRPQLYDGKEILIKSGTVLASDEYGFIFIAADFPFFRYFDGNGELHISEIERNRNVEALFALDDEGNLSFNEYLFPLEGPHGIDVRYATPEERQRLLNAISDFTNQSL